MNLGIYYYELRSSGLGSIFTNGVDAGFARIREHPEAWRLVGKRTRRLVLPKFPYSLIYETREDCLMILAVAHHRKRPHYWRARR